MVVRSDNVTPDSNPLDLRPILDWYRKHGKTYPWSGGSQGGSAYAVWISEVMLQQTTVSAVLPRFERWMSRFPDLVTLGEAEEDHVLREWEGLGYYSRARNLHSAAREVLRDYSGNIPSDVKALRKLPGVGEYIASAIGAFAFGRPVAVVDANIRRIIQRLLAADTWSRDLEKTYKEAALHLIGRSDSPSVNAALMQFGQGICLPRTPKCEECPLQERCAARKRGQEKNIPPRRRKEVVRKTTDIAVMLNKNQVWLHRRNSGIVAGLWTFPSAQDMENPEFWVPGDFLPRQIHSYTRYRDELRPRIYRPAGDGAELAPGNPTLGGLWSRIDALDAYGMPSAHRRIADNLIEQLVSGDRNPDN